MTAPINPIRRAAVIGAGTMGAGIAAQIANGGIPVLLLDIVPPNADASQRSSIAEGAVARMAKTNPAPLMLPGFSRLIETGNIADDLGKLAECDWIIEAVVERLDIKQDLYRKIDALRHPTAIVSSNTSTIPLDRLVEGLSEDFGRHFCITHFFNPPRYMRLLELVTSPRTSPEAARSLADFTDRVMGKTVIRCKDRPGFIANRLGVYWMQCALVEALEHGVSVEEADAVVGPPMGIPRTGVFGLFDLVGLDLMPQVVASLVQNLPASDDFARIGRNVPALGDLVAQGFTGRKTKGGFYRQEKQDGKPVKLAVDLATGAVRPSVAAALASVAAVKTEGLRGLLNHEDRGGRYGWAVLSATLCYAAELVPEVADEIASIDEAMRLGYNWSYGPFELLDSLGADWFAAKLEAEGRPVPALIAKAVGRAFYRRVEGGREALGPDGQYHPVARPAGVLLLEDIKQGNKAVARNEQASLWDIGDGVLCLEFHTKMNAMDSGILEMIRNAITLVPRQWRGLVIYNEGAAFSAGANLDKLAKWAEAGDWDSIAGLIREGQETYRALKYAPFPVVGAPTGSALGGGCEVLLHCDAIQAHAESFLGLPECSLGLLPAWGGCTEVLGRFVGRKDLPQGPMPALEQVFDLISQAKVSRSAAEARALGLLRPEDGITMNRDRLLADAKARVLDLAEGYQPPEPRLLSLPGEGGQAGLRQRLDAAFATGKASAFDLVVADALANVLSGGVEAQPFLPVTEEQLSALEAAQFVAQLQKPETLARIRHLLATGKPLKN